MKPWCVQVQRFYAHRNVLIGNKKYLFYYADWVGELLIWANSVSICDDAIQNCWTSINAPPWNTYTLCVEETCANAFRNQHAMLCCTASDIWPFKHFFDVDLVCVMQFSLLELVDVVKLFDFIVWFSNEWMNVNVFPQ
jgi:hypothetical protein